MSDSKKMSFHPTVGLDRAERVEDAWLQGVFFFFFLPA